MHTVRRGDPIYYRDKLVARFARGTTVDGQYLRWSWFNPKTSDEMARGPQYHTLMDGRKEPVNRGIITLDYARGDLQVWVAWDLTGDIDSAFDNRDMFLPPDAVVSELPDGVGEAARIIKGTIHPGSMPDFVHYLDYLMKKGERFAEL